ncbi:MAG: hypothetical protein ACYC6L_12055 [Anaerolineae bacterium]
MIPRWQVILLVVLVISAVLLSRCGQPVNTLTPEPQPVGTQPAVPAVTRTPSLAPTTAGAPTCSPKRP